MDKATQNLRPHAVSPSAPRRARLPGRAAVRRSPPNVEFFSLVMHSSAAAVAALESMRWWAYSALSSLQFVWAAVAVAQCTAASYVGSKHARSAAAVDLWYSEVHTFAFASALCSGGDSHHRCGFRVSARTGPSSEQHSYLCVS
mmetsp:Transcript_55291/g.140507  ORF Transcript_55291/g.140507 Transcript_55291/m.140507 type:complete len:144 (+) Transcript_55291:352-783(+)